MWPSASFVREPEHKYSYVVREPEHKYSYVVRKIELTQTISNIFFKNTNLA